MAVGFRMTKQGCCPRLVSTGDAAETDWHSPEPAILTKSLKAQIQRATQLPRPSALDPAIRSIRTGSGLGSLFRDALRKASTEFNTSARPLRDLVP